MSTAEDIKARAKLTNFIQMTAQIQEKCFVDNTGGRKVPPAYTSVEAFVLKHGTFWTPGRWPRGKGYKRGPYKACFQNAFRLADAHPELRYVEGLADSNLIPTHHAWTINGAGEVIDPTWRDGKGDLGAAYCGVVFPKEFLYTIMCLTGVYGVLDTWGRGFSLLKDPYDETEALARMRALLEEKKAASLAKARNHFGGGGG